MVRLPERVRIGVIGLGWIGQEVVRASMEDPRVQLVGLADSDPAKAGRDVGEIIGEGRLGIPIDKSVAELMMRARPEVAVVCTSSDVQAILPTLSECLDQGAHVVTTCENLADPEVIDGAACRKLHEHARKKGVVVLATGVNPGFAMDRLPIMLTQATRNIRRVRVARVVDAATRRAQLQHKVGIGMTPAAFSQAMKLGVVGHQGLSASMRIIAKGLGVTLDNSSETLLPLIAEYPTRSSVLGTVDVGNVRGIYQVARGFRGRRELITLEVTIALDERNARDTIDIVGEPPIHFQGELPGDACTVATVLSAIPVVVTMQPGLRTVLDVPLEQPEEPASAQALRVSLIPRGATELPGPAPLAAANKIGAGKNGAASKRARPSKAQLGSLPLDELGVATIPAPPASPPALMTSPPKRLKGIDTRAAKLTPISSAAPNLPLASAAANRAPTPLTTAAKKSPTKTAKKAAGSKKAKKKSKSAR